MSRAEESLTAVLAAMPDASPFLIPRPGDAELPATVILDRAWLAGQLRLRGQIWGTGDQRTLATLWWYSASAMLVRPSLLALAADGTCLSPRLEHIVIHHQPSSRFSGSHGTQAMPGDDLGAYAAALGATVGTVIGQLRPYVPRPRPLWAIAADAIAGRLLWAGQQRGTDIPAAALAAQPVPKISFAQVGDATRFRRRRMSWLLSGGPFAAA
jgi:ferric iron reductase protein FhuF